VTATLLRLNRRTFASLRKHRNYRLFFAGQLVSLPGTWMQRIAQAWLVLSLTHSPVAVGVLALAQFLPFTVFGLFAGVVVDRLDARRAVIGTQAASMALAAALAAVVLAGVVEPWYVYAIAAVQGSVQVLDAPARQALTYRMVGPTELPNAVALNSSLFNGSRILGPALGGAIIATAGVGICFAINAASFLAVLAGLFAIREGDLHPVGRAEHSTLLRGVREGLAYARRAPQVLVTLFVVLMLSTFCFNFNVLLPVLARQTLHGGAAVFGVLSACFGAGALLGALLAAESGRASLRTLLLATTAFAGLQLVHAPVHSAVACGLLLFATGACFTLWTSNSNSSLQLGAPDHLRGRVVGLYYYCFNGLGPVGGLLAGWLAAKGGTQLAFLVAGAIGIAASGLAAARLQMPAGRFTSA